MSNFYVSLSHEPAAASWGANAKLSFVEGGAVLHLPDSGLNLRQIQKSTRKIGALGVENIEFVGDWDAEQQWAFATSYCGAGFKGAITWCKNADESDLKTRFSAMQFTRRLVNETPEELSPESLATEAAEWIHSLAPEHVTTRMLTGEELLEAGWHGIYEVGRGSCRPPVLLELDYNPTGKPDAVIDFALVGKGITFDSGGYSIKSSEGMLDMKCDMGGAATVTGALGLAIMQGLKKRTKLFLCCAENLISDHAYKLGDIITYKNGVTVEIVNTDAEGRLVLADGLMAATESGALKIIDAATLTGAAVMAVGKEFNAIFSLDEEFQASFLASAAKVHEPHWRLPLMPWHQEQCASPFADTANSRPVKGGGAGGASNAAGFLSRFVGNEGKGWVHIDLAAAYNRNGTELMPNGATAIGIRTIADQLIG
ncbi:aminopeptidase PepB [Brumicola nitratireducens]|uniref:Aminopeptidase B n=1 Tax=Glaciecola nitratireducens (strain JCM 12485 / KCTC 12276 / FR1064) TaxID=1085623 RepID=G4QJL9_GLANF|nr:aminopeptidase PepB [Glaciecola nitratireducens]AEP28679.1 aminopeptidase B [Glaciecola nitratireducens FR1064]